MAHSSRLPYNWGKKLRDLVAGICLSRSLMLQSIAQTRSQPVKTTENVLSQFLGQKRLKMSKQQRRCVERALKRLPRRRIWKHNGKVAVLIDSTAHAKCRSRGKKRPMPGKGKVRLHNLPADETVLVPGYQEIWVCLLLDDQTVLPITRRLWSENGPECASLNLVEEAVIREATDFIKKVLKLDVILVADSGFRRKELLHWLKKSEKMDFVIRLEGKLTVALDEAKCLLAEAGPWWRKRVRMQWRERSKHVMLSDVASRRVTVVTEARKKVSFNALCLTPVGVEKDPMFLATTLTTEGVADLIRIVRLYSWRWGIETFFGKFKNALGARSWRVFSSWRAIDNLLTAAHMAYMVLAMLAEFAEQGRTTALRRLWGWMEEMLRTRFARPPKMTLGRFMRLIAMDFPSPCPAGVAA
ncbi:MAG: transposase [Elusimicrobia bacterium]|nr:transposase [Elusimicrobiota bacterium]